MRGGGLQGGRSGGSCKIAIPASGLQDCDTDTDTDGLCEMVEEDLPGEYLINPALIFSSKAIEIPGLGNSVVVEHQLFLAADIALAP